MKTYVLVGPIFWDVENHQRDKPNSDTMSKNKASTTVVLGDLAKKKTKMSPLPMVPEKYATH